MKILLNHPKASGKIYIPLLIMVKSKLRIGVINGPNLNLTGKREIDIYGKISFDTYIKNLKKKYKHVEIDYFQSNVEGEIINALHDFSEKCDGIILNPGGYSHTSVSIADAVRAINIPVIEVHLSKIFSREEYRQVLITAAAAQGFISGFGLDSYELALLHFVSQGK
jgi:3-dehydroquinate dehydratase-2